MPSNTCAVHPSSQHVDLLQSGDSNGCEVIGSYITIHQGQSLASFGCAALVQGEGIGVAQDGDENNTRIVGAEHEVIQSGHQNLALVLGGLGNQITQNGFGSKVEIVDGNHCFNRIRQCGPVCTADLRGSRNLIKQDGGPTVMIKGNRNRVLQHGLDNECRIGRHRNFVKQTGNQNVVRVRGNENQVKSSGFNNRGSVRGDGNCVAIAGKENRIAAVGCGNKVAVRGRRNLVAISGDNQNIQIDASGLQGAFSNGTFVPAEGFRGQVSVTVLEVEGGPLHMITVC